MLFDPTSPFFQKLEPLIIRLSRTRTKQDTQAAYVELSETIFAECGETPAAMHAITSSIK
jgi:hypothetical protein